MEDLPLQVAEVDGVEVDDAERADAGGREIHRHGRSEPARAYAQDLRGLQPALTVDADLRHDQVARVALHFVVGQRLADAPETAQRRRGHSLYTSRDGRDDADRIAGADWCLLLLQVPDVLVV